MGPLSVLIVAEAEDSATWFVRELRSLARRDVRARHERTGAGLHAALAAQACDLVIVTDDVCDVAWSSVVAAVVESDTEVPVLVFSDEAEAGLAAQAMELGARDCLLYGDRARFGHVVRRELQALTDRRELRRVEAELRASQALYESERASHIGECRVLEMVASGARMSEALDLLSRVVEEQADGMLASILLLEDGVLRHGAAPSLPREFMSVVDGRSIGPNRGSCGTAAYAKKAVIVTDIAVDPRWEKLRAAALSSGLRASWAAPILSRSGSVLGTFGLYYREPRTPEPRQLELIERASHLAAIVIERHHAEGVIGELKEDLEARIQQRTQDLEHALFALRESEETFRSLTHSALSAIVMLDETGAVSLWNPAAESIFGWPADRVLGRKLEEFMVPERFRERHRKGLERFLATGTGAAIGETLELSALRSDGKEMPVELSLSAVHLRGRWAAVGTLNDITLRHEVQQELIRAREAAESANEAKSVFLANMSHEIRTPMNAILGFAQLLSSDAGLSPAQAENVAVIESSGRHLLALINDVLEMSKIESGRTTLCIEACDLQRLLTDLEGMFRLRTNGKGLFLEIEIGTGVPRHVATDEHKLRQVLINLIGNAVKFTNQGGVTVRVASLQAKEKITRLQFEVEDTGSGIPDEFQKLVFEPFAQTDDGARAQGGTGLGLAISKKCVSLMGGDLELDSAVGRGSTFRFDVSVSVVSPGELRHTHPRSIACLASGQPQVRVLVVDDNEINRLLFVRMLEPLGFVVRQAANGFLALRELEREPVELVLMDLRMPVMDGYEATRRIRATELGRTVRIVTVTAAGIENDDAMLRAAGADDVLRKPFSQDMALEVIRTQLGLRFEYGQKPRAEGPCSFAGEPPAISRPSLKRTPA